MCARVRASIENERHDLNIISIIITMLDISRRTMTKNNNNIENVWVRDGMYLFAHTIE